ncbi:MAG: hypothetical protein ACLSHM_01535 [Vescimonas sp.]
MGPPDQNAHCVHAWLTLQNEDSDLAGSLSGDLMRVEQYVEMVLVFLPGWTAAPRTMLSGSAAWTTLCVRRVRRFAGEFIHAGSCGWNTSHWTTPL